jgi:formamidopyrimidine-DNA glycosylase
VPELPEVETIARGLARRIEGRVIARVQLHRRDMLHGNGGAIDGLVGWGIHEVRRCGKQVRILLQPEATIHRRDAGAAPQKHITEVSVGNSEQWLYVHLGMTGRLLVVDHEELVEKHTHLQIDLENSKSQLRFCDPRRFGGIWLIAGAGHGQNGWVGRRLPPIGADPLEISLPALRAVLARKRQIKPLLMDQVPISGMGNIYCDEALFRAGIHPLTPAGDLGPEAVRRLRTAIRRVLAEAIKAGGSSISDYRDADNARGSFQERHRVYGREGCPCPACGSTIERLVVAGRGTHVCPRCQPLH